MDILTGREEITKVLKEGKIITLNYGLASTEPRYYRLTATNIIQYSDDLIDWRESSMNIYTFNYKESYKVINK